MRRLFPRIFNALGALLVALAFALPAQAANLVETARNAGQFSILLDLAGEAGMAGTLSSGGPYTVLAPTDAAFAALGPGGVEDLKKPQNRENLQAIIQYHVIGGRHGPDAGTLETYEGTELTLSGGQVTTNLYNATIGQTVDASNGVIHVIDQVLIPLTNERE